MALSQEDRLILDAAKRELVTANRILNREGILDAYGHLSIRHPLRPDRLLISRDRAPGLVEADDVLELDLEGEEPEPTGSGLYGERYIHAAVYAARPDINAVCHNHATEFLPFTVVESVPLDIVVHMAAIMGGPIPLWDMAVDFGPDTDLLVACMDHGRSLVRTLGDGYGVLMRGHGSVVVGSDVRWAVARSIELVKNAKVQMDARALGDITPIYDGEIKAFMEMTPSGNSGFHRAWEYWSRRAGM
ncbi:MAG TPA: class II aldolase/adducin family protein [Acidimicrobiales bacterium]|jgi:HCOMODA/2-hydroxy-3-carboxy-muconic semialdehyde decarboxylase|nr:class II aldolase/adducin family protein [Acidimicrobiales bacterium]